MEEHQQSSAGSLANTNWKVLNAEIRGKMKIEFLLESLRTKEKWILEKAIEVAKEQPSPVPQDNDNLAQAELALQIVNMQIDLREAQKSKNPDMIKAALQRIPTSEKYMFYLQQDVAQAHSDLVRYERMVLLRRSILNMDMKTMSEMRRYHNPPPMIHAVMKAVMLYFGEHEETTQDWRVVQKALNPHGHDGMNRRVLNLDVSKIHPAICARVRELLEEINLDKLKMVSPGAATFYVWAMGVADTVEIQRGSDLPANVWRQKEIFGCQAHHPHGSPKNKRRCHPMGHRPHWQK